MKLLIKGGRIIDPALESDFCGDILISDGTISAIERQITPPADVKRIIDATGLTVTAGLIDLHVHLREPGREDEETIASGSRAAIHGGFTTIACMPNTDPVNDNQAVCDFILSQAAVRGACRVLPVGAITKKQQGKELAEMAELKERGAVAFSDDGNPVMGADVMRRAMEYSLMLDCPIISHCEDLNLSQKGVMNEGLSSTRLGLPPIPAAAESIMAARDIALAELTGARLHLAHVSCAQTVELVRIAKDKGLRVTAEVTPHHFTLTDETVATFDTNTKVNPPLRTPKDIDALIAGLRDGAIDAIASDHAPHCLAEKELEYTRAPFGLIGLETTLGLTLTRLVEPGHLSLAQAIEKLSCNPARILDLPLGRLVPGLAADIVLFDPAAKTTVSAESLFSKSRNTPFLGWTLAGEVKTTIVAGKVAYNIIA